MAFGNGYMTVVTIDGKDMSAYTNSVQFNRSADTHDVTTMGKTSKVYQSGLKDGTATIQGFYEGSVNGPGKVFRPLVGGAAVTLVYRPEGTGSTKPEAEVDVIVSAYEETAAVADVTSFSVTLQFTDSIDDTAQS